MVLVCGAVTTRRGKLYLEKTRKNEVDKEIGIYICYILREETKPKFDKTLPLTALMTLESSSLSLQASLRALQVCSEKGYGPP